MDKGKNISGKLLINLCKGQNLFIMNAREGSDINIGELTCKNASAVDYFICTPSLIKCIDDLTVLDFSKCCSDVHTPLTCSCVILDASKSRSLLRRSEIACLLKLPLNSCNFSFSHFFGFSQCVLYYLKHLYHYLQKHSFQK
jgi:hypothetical protein